MLFRSDLDVLRNRPDAYGHVGVARDLAAHFSLPLTAPSGTLQATGPERVTPVDIVDGARCPRFTSLVISNVAVGTSPDWVVRRLAAAGMRSINNIVDVSNYVMLETNQPNHAYDLDTLGGGGFRVRLAREGESMITLDDVERELSANDLLICDATDRPIGIAGIMGGQNTEISEATTTIAVEAAWFEPTAIMQSVVRLGLRSEASARFERGVDPYGIEASVARFVELLRLTCPDLVVHRGWADARTEHMPRPVSITVRPERVSALLGRPFSAADIVSLVEPLGFGCRIEAGVVQVAVPTWRPDCTLEVDIDRKSTRLNSSHIPLSRMPSSA